MKTFKPLIDYKKELETASRGMIMIHDPKLLIKLIVRMIVHKLKIKHAAMILHDVDRDAYVLNISRGEKGFRIPQGFTKFGKESPIINLFTDPRYKNLVKDRRAVVFEDINRMIWRESLLNHASSVKTLLHSVSDQMQMLNTTACVPAYHSHDLLAVLLLGGKDCDESFTQEELDFFAALASDAAMAIRNAQLFEDLKRESERNHELFIQTIRVLGSTIEAKDAYTHGHTERVTRYSIAIANQMTKNGSMAFDESFLENLYIAGLLHDIGKIGVPEIILNKTNGLTNEEFEIMKKHPARGVEIVKPLGLPRQCLDGIEFHHERYDGRGYPQGLKAEEIPICAAIMAVADTFDAMTSDRPYRKGLAKDIAIKEIENNSTTQFNPQPVKAMLEIYHQGLV